MLRCDACRFAAFCPEACAGAGWAAHAAVCRATAEAGEKPWEFSPLVPVVPMESAAAAPAKQLRRVDVALAAARADELAPPATLLSIAAPVLLAFFDTRSVLPLRASCTETRDAVAAAPWADSSTPITGSLRAWRACFPAARAAKLQGRSDVDPCFLLKRGDINPEGMFFCWQSIITDADFVHLRGIHTLDMTDCIQEGITDAAFAHLRGIHTLDMSGCYQEGISDAAFVNLRGIHELDMSFCNQEGITDAAFVRLRGIHTLDMSNCDQSNITRSTITHLGRIRCLWVTDCCGDVQAAALGRIRGEFVRRRF